MSNTILITGSATGFGREMTLKFAREGWDVIATVKDFDDSAKDLEQIASKDNLKINILKVDVTNQADIDALQEHLVSSNIKIDVLVNNAGFGYVGPVEDFTIEEVIAQYDVNLFGVLRLNQIIVPLMRKAGGGKIINISSVNGLVSFPLYGIYSSSKFALETISEVQRFELAPFNIKVSLVEPGGFATNFSNNKKIAKKTLNSDSVYHEWATKFLMGFDDLSKSEGILSKFINPTKVADLVWKIANSHNPSLRYKIGLDTWFYTVARRILPYSVWRFCINWAFKWK